MPRHYVEFQMEFQMLAADTSRAFDSIEHERLLDKLGWYGVDVHWFEDWLKNRSQSIQGTRAARHGHCQ